MFILQLMYLIIRLIIKGITHFITGLLQQYRLGFYHSDHYNSYYNGIGYGNTVVIVNSNYSSRNTCGIVNHNNTNGNYSGNKTNTANKSTNTANKATNTSSSKASTSKSAKLLVTS